jgi:hypothetical protein
MEMELNWNEKIFIENNLDAVFVAGSIRLEDKGTEIIDPICQPIEVINAIKFQYNRGKIKVTNDFEEVLELEDMKDRNTSKVHTVNGVDGDTFEHTIYDNNSGMFSVNAINAGKAMEVFPASSDTGLIEISYNDLDRAEAVIFINQQWKKFESEVNKSTDKRKLLFYLNIANELGASEKKVAILSNRLGVL